MNIIPLCPAGAPEFLVADQVPVHLFQAALDDAISQGAKDGVGAQDAPAYSALRRFDSANGLFAARDLTDQLKVILAKPYPSNEGLDNAIIPQRAFTGVGYEHTEIARTDFSGSVVPWNGDRNVPFVDVDAERESFDVQHYACAMQITKFERESVGNRLFNILDMRTNACRMVHAMAASRRVWRGCTTGLPGVLSHPWIPVRFNALDVRTADVDVLIAEFATAINFAADTTPGDTGKTNNVKIASKLVRALKARRLPNTWGFANLWEYIVAQHTDCQFIPVHSLIAAGPGSQHGMVTTNASDEYALFNDIVTPTTFLAPQTEAGKDIIFVYMTWAGVKSFNPFQNCITYFTGF